MFNKLKQFKDLRSQAKDLQGQLAKEQVEGSAAFNKIKVKINGNQEIISVEIDPEFISKENKEKIQDGIKEATNQAIKKAQKIMAEKVRSGNIDMSAFGM